MGESESLRDLIAATIAAHVDIIRRQGDEGLAVAYSISCSCGAEAEVVPSLLGWDLKAWMVEFRLHRADAVLTALTDTGAFLPSGGSTSDEWQVTYRHNCHPHLVGLPTGPCRISPHREVWMAAISEADARRGLVTCRDEANWAESRIEQRTVTRWPNGATYTGPWREVVDG